MMKLVQMLQMLIMRSLNASCGICGFANEFGILVTEDRMQNFRSLGQPLLGERYPDQRRREQKVALEGVPDGLAGP